MHCFECAKLNDTVDAVGICRNCGVGLCFDHIVEASAFRSGGVLGCTHEMPKVKPLVNVPAGIAESARHHSATVK